MIPIVGNRDCNQRYQNSSNNAGQIIKEDMLCDGSEGQDSSRETPGVQLEMHLDPGRTGGADPVLSLSQVLWLLLLTLPCLGGSVPVTSDPGPRPEQVVVVGGHDASLGAWPWQAGLWFWNETVFYWGLICGGSLIDPQWVLTAAHCIKETNPDPQHFKVQLGGVRPSLIDSVPVSRIIRHPEYRTEEGALGGADVALLKLGSPVLPSNLVKWIRLQPPSAAFPPGTRCWLTGWGKIGPEEPLPWPYNLQEVEVPIVADETCRQQYGKVIKDDMLCAGGWGQNSCQGDSGGPLVCKWNHTWVQVGVVSIGYKCGLFGKPGVYVRVKYYLPWIHHHIPSSP